MLNAEDRIKKAEFFLLNSIRYPGLAYSYDALRRVYVKPYPEVTGYLLSYFSNYYDVIPDKIISAADFLIKIQSKNGGYSSFSGRDILFTFDTAQIMHGFLSLFKKTKNEKYLKAAKRCADFIIKSQIGNGAMFPVYNKKDSAFYVNKVGGWGTDFSYIQTKNLEGLHFLWEIIKKDELLDTILKLKDFGKNNCNLYYTHPGAYCLEGLFAIGEKDFVFEKLKKDIIPRIESDGFLPYYKGSKYAYVSGSAQMGILLHQSGFFEYSDLILSWLRKVQDNHGSGGLFQYANKDCTLNSDIHSELNTWGTKYYVQLQRISNKN